MSCGVKGALPAADARPRKMTATLSAANHCFPARSEAWLCNNEQQSWFG